MGPVRGCPLWGIFRLRKEAGGPSCVCPRPSCPRASQRTEWTGRGGLGGAHSALPLLWGRRKVRRGPPSQGPGGRAGCSVWQPVCIFLCPGFQEIEELFPLFLLSISFRFLACDFCFCTQLELGCLSCLYFYLLYKFQVYKMHYNSTSVYTTESSLPKV